MKNMIALSLLFILILGCANQNQQARTEGTAGGAVVGGLLGGLLGYAAGKQKGALAGAALGSILGGSIGYAYADNIANRHRELAGHENDLDAQIKFAEGVNHDTQQYNQRLKSDIANLTPEVNNLVAQAQQERITQQQLNAKKRSIERKVEETKTALAAAEKQYRNLKDFQNRTPNKSDKLDAEIAKLESNLAELKQNTNAIASLGQRL